VLLGHAQIDVVNNTTVFSVDWSGSTPCKLRHDVSTVSRAEYGIFLVVALYQRKASSGVGYNSLKTPILI
jgi:hypothetical protein